MADGPVCPDARWRRLCDRNGSDTYMLMAFISQQHREDSMIIEVVFELDAYVETTPRRLTIGFQFQGQPSFLEVCW